MYFYEYIALVQLCCRMVYFLSVGFECHCSYGKSHSEPPPSFLVLWLHLILFFSLYHTITSVMLRLHMTTMLAWLGTIETRLVQHQHNPMAPSHR